jgi:ATP synthase protein I
MHEHDASILRAALVPTAVAGVLAVVVAAFVGGGKAALGAALGALVVVVFFTVGLVVVGRASRVSAYAAMNAAILTYLVKIGVLFALIVAFKDTTLFNTKAFGLTIVLCTLVWTGFEVRGFSRLQILYVDPKDADRH